MALSKDARRYARTAEQYCNRLSAILTTPDLHAKFRVALTDDEWKELFANEENPDQCVLFKRLFDSPRLQSIAASATSYTPSVWLLEQELLARGKEQKICEAQPSCGHFGKDPARTCIAGTDAVYKIAREVNAKGLCFSSGGIRSATFNLGILQALSRLKLLNEFTYLSSVSGGGYIHMFLTAWLHYREKFDPTDDPNSSSGPPRQDLEFVETQLDPLPQQREKPLTEQPEPIRWLRRYSNYLTPRTGLFSTDTWVMIAVWLRNTFLNQLVLISFIATILCLPHMLQTSGRMYEALKVLYTYSFLHIGSIIPLLLVTALGLYTIVQLRELLPKCAAANDRRTATLPPTDCDRPIRANVVRRWKSVGTALLAISILASPAVYRASFVTPAPLEAAEKYGRPTPCSTDCQTTNQPASRTTIKTVDETTVDTTETRGITTTTSKATSTSTISDTAVRTASATPVQKKQARILPSLNRDLPAWCKYVPPVHRRRETLRNWFSNYTYPFWNWAAPGFSMEAILLVFTAVLCLVAARASREDSEKGSWWSIVSALVSTAATIGMLHLVRLSFFVLSFFLPPLLFRSCGIVLMPVLVMAILFLALVLTAGIMGNLTDDARREDMARLRALGFSISFLWFAATAFSLLGPELVHQLAGLTYVRSLLSLGWIGTTISSVLAGKSAKTSSMTDNSGFMLKLLIKIGPPVFVLGLILLISTALNAALVQFCFSEAGIFVSFLILGSIAALFGFRIDINDFSMHAFYRDRIARCFAGASHPHRRPDRFTALQRATVKSESPISSQSSSETIRPAILFQIANMLAHSQSFAPPSTSPSGRTSHGRSAKPPASPSLRFTPATVLAGPPTMFYAKAANTPITASSRHMITLTLLLEFRCTQPSRSPARP